MVNRIVAPISPVLLLAAEEDLDGDVVAVVEEVAVVGGFVEEEPMPELLESRTPLWLDKRRKKIRLAGRITIDANRGPEKLPGVVVCQVELLRKYERDTPRFVQFTMCLP
jgi:hypothetical protein